MPFILGEILANVLFLIVQISHHSLYLNNASVTISLISLVVKGVSKDCTAALINHNTVVVLVVRVFVYTWVVVGIGQLLVKVNILDVATHVAYLSLLMVASTDDLVFRCGVRLYLGSGVKSESDGSEEESGDKDLREIYCYDEEIDRGVKCEEEEEC